MQKSRSGFTIVELLIVIVVIAILAAISITAYTGIQNRAYNTKAISGTTQYQKTLIAYKAVNGSYPSMDGCLGKNYPNNACWANDANGGSPIGFQVNATLDAALSEFLSSKPEVGTELISIAPSANQYRGGLVYIYNDGSLGHRLTYYLKGNNSDCGLAVTNKGNEGPLTQCNISLP